MGFLEQPPDGGSSCGPVIERPLVGVHLDEPVHAVRAQAPRELRGVGNGFVSMFQPVPDAFADVAAHLSHHVRLKIAPDNVSTKRQGEAGSLAPPLPKIENSLEA